MAFQTGSQVRPELGRADVSGFARGGMAIGAGVLQGIENYQEQKQITSFALSDLEGRMTADPSILAAMEQAGQNNPKIGKALKSLKEGDYKQNDVLTLSGFASSLQSQKAAMQLATLTQAKLDSLSQPKRPTIGDITKLREFLPSDKVIEDGRIVDTTLRNEILPENYLVLELWPYLKIAIIRPSAVISCSSLTKNPQPAGPKLPLIADPSLVPSVCQRVTFE